MKFAVPLIFVCCLALPFVPQEGESDNDTVLIYGDPSGLVMQADGSGIYTAPNGNTTRFTNFENIQFVQSVNEMTYDQTMVIDNDTLPTSGLPFTDLAGVITPPNAGTLIIQPTNPPTALFTPQSGFVGEVDFVFSATNSVGVAINSASVPFFVIVTAPTAEAATSLVPSGRPPVDKSAPIGRAILPELPRETVDTTYDRTRFPYNEPKK